MKVMNGYNNYGGYNNDRQGLGALSRALVFIVLLVAVLAGVAVLGLTRDPIEEAQAAGLMVGVAREAANLEADKTTMPAVSQAEANATIAQINSEAQTRAVIDDVNRRSIIHDQAHQEAVAAEELQYTRNMHQIVESLTLGGGVALITLLALGSAWFAYKDINSRLAVRVAARAAQVAQLTAAQAVAAAQAPAIPASAASPAAAATPAPTRATPVAPPIIGRLPDLPTGQPRRERPAPQPAPAAPAPIVHRLPSRGPGHAWLEQALGHGVYPNGHGCNGGPTNGNGQNDDLYVDTHSRNGHR
jgi:hypothetical protein